MISLADARRIITDAIQPAAPAVLPLGEALGCVLAEDVKVDSDFPAADLSMMDGYAMGEGSGGEFRLVGEVRTGTVAEFAVGPGECARIFTGAPLPRGAAAIVPQEHAERNGGVVKVVERSAKNFIRRRGAEARAGDVVLARGARIGATEAAALAQAGAARVLVHPPARAGHIATGDELVAPDAPLTPGKIRDTNSSLLAALVAETGARLAGQARCGDDPAALAAWVRENAGDVLLISGGASVGDYDFGARVLREAGFTIHFDKVNLRPGKPLTFATRGAQAAFVIPGNPVSHFVCFHVAIRLALELRQAVAPLWETVDLPLGGTEALRGDSRETWWPARVVASGGRLSAEPKRWSSSGDTFSLPGTNALIRLVSDAAPGVAVPVLLLGAIG